MNKKTKLEKEVVKLRSQTEKRPKYSFPQIAKMVFEQKLTDCVLSRERVGQIYRAGLLNKGNKNETKRIKI